VALADVEAGYRTDANIWQRPRFLAIAWFTVICDPLFTCE
jgi:hypothetical protein